MVQERSYEGYSHWQCCKGRVTQASLSSLLTTNFPVAEHGTTGLNVFHDAFRFCFGPILFYSFLPFWMRMITLSYFMSIMFSFLFIFTGFQSWEFAKSFRKTLGLDIFSNAETVINLLAMLRDELHAFCLKRFSWAFWHPGQNVLLCIFVSFTRLMFS